MSETYDTLTTPSAAPALPLARLSPQLFMGVASPLWGYYGAAVAGGMALWWMRQWVGAPKNLEALLASAPLETNMSVEPPASPTVSASAPGAPVGFALVDAVAESLAMDSEPAPVEEPPEVPADPVSDPVPEPGPDTVPSPDEEPMRMDASPKPGKRHTPKIPGPDAG